MRPFPQRFLIVIAGTLCMLASLAAQNPSQATSRPAAPQPAGGNGHATNGDVAHRQVRGATSQPGEHATNPAGVPTSQPVLQPTSGYIVPEMIFATVDTNGEPVTVPYDYPGKLIVVHFWATWCSSCAREVPFWIEAQKGFADRGVAFVGVPTDKNRGTPVDTVKQRAAQRGFTWPQIYDDAVTMSRDFQVNALPSVYIVDGDTGKVLAQGNPVRKKNLAKVLNFLLEQRHKSAPVTPANPPNTPSEPKPDAAHRD